jgi:hypothetical protein
MRRLTCGVVGLLAFLTTAASAGAAPITIGVPLQGPFGSSASSAVPFTLINRTIAEPGALATSPVSGLIVRWSMVGGVGGPFRLRVLRPAGDSAYTAVGTSAAVLPAGTGIETFATAMPIAAGDTIGFDIPKGSKIAAIPNPAAVFGVLTPIIVEGTTQSLAGSEAGAEFAFNALVQPAPTIASVAPKTGSFKGGSKVTIRGADFTGVSAVSFGSLPAKRFTVDSESQITAFSPAVGKPGRANITVTTIAGATPPAPYKAAACVVPKLKEKTLTAAKRRLKKAGCKVGRVNKEDGVSAKTGKVVKQGKPAGKKLAPGAKVNVTLG